MAKLDSVPFPEASSKNSEGLANGSRSRPDAPADALALIAAKKAHNVRLRRQYANFHRTLAVDKNLILWESYSGAGMVCSPYAMFRYMLGRQEYAHFTHVWTIVDAAERGRLSAEYAEANNVRFVEHGGEDYARAMATAGFMIGNVSMPLAFSKRPGQVVVNTWHSVTLKTLGFSQPNGVMASRNILRSFMGSDYIISPNPFMTTIYRTDYKLDGIFEGEILETGFPRADLLTQVSNEEIIAKLAVRGVVVDPTKKTIVYAPTWRGELAAKASAETSLFEDFVSTVTDRIDTSRYQILVRLHSVTYQLLEKLGADLSKYIPPSVDANELLAVADVLVADYSSIIYDYLPTGRPVLFFMPDLESYQKERGLVLKPDTLPGPVTESVEQIADWISDECRVAESFANARAAQAEWAGPYDDGQASKRSVEQIFGEHSDKKPPKSFEKTRLLIYGGRFEMNGVTTTLIATLKALDYKRYDVTLYVKEPKSKLQTKLISWVSPQVRILSRISTMACTENEDIICDKFLGGELEANAYLNEDVQTAFAREYKRCFGDVRFDIVVDYSGYSLYWPALLAQAPEAKSIIWQNSELPRDFNNAEKRATTRADRPLPTVAAMADMYKFIDRVVGHGEHVMQINKAAMSLPETEHKFVHISNLVDDERVLRGKKNRFCFLAKNESKKLKQVVERIDQPNGQRLSDGYVYADVSPWNKSGKKASKTDVPLPLPNEINFVAMGRYSPEKNHMGLIRAFDRFHTETPASKLYIIGDGAIRSDYENLIAELGLEEYVILTGMLKNPYGLTSLCSCFVLPSIYEGVGIVAIESRLIDLPIIVASYGSVASVTLPDGQYVIDSSVDGIADGLFAFRDGKVPLDRTFDVSAHNARCMAEIYQALEAPV